MGDHSDGLIMSHAPDLAAIYDLENASFGPGCSVGSLIENPPQLAAALRRAVVRVYSRALFVARTYAYPRGEVLRRRKGCCAGAHFGNDLLCRIRSQSGYLCQPPHRVLMLAEQTRHFWVQFADLLLNQL